MDKFCTVHHVQFSDFFAIFHQPTHTKGTWTIDKNPRPIVKFDCVNGCDFSSSENLTFNILTQDFLKTAYWLRLAMSLYLWNPLFFLKQIQNYN